ncbi:MAG TPA: hypothetical protein DIV98_03770 [Oceanicaulis sp.]|nr:hypothetical protein [Oceanicaulis sp.]
MRVILKAAAVGLALGILTFGASASALAADPEGRFRISAEMDGYLTIHSDGSMDLDAALASEIFGISWPPSGVGWGNWVRTGEGEITFTYTGDQGELTYICGDWPGYAVGESLDAGELCWLGHGAGKGLELDSATRVE